MTPDDHVAELRRFEAQLTAAEEALFTAEVQAMKAGRDTLPGRLNVLDDAAHLCARWKRAVRIKRRSIRYLLAAALCVLAPIAAHSEVVMTPFDDRGQPVVVKPWDPLTEDERIEQLRALSTAHCFSYQRLEMRGGSPVCVESRR